MKELPQQKVANIASAQNREERLICYSTERQLAATSLFLIYYQTVAPPPEALGLLDLYRTCALQAKQNPSDPRLSHVCIRFIVCVQLFSFM